MKILGITGKKRSGKDTLCEILNDVPNIPVLRRAFADPLKEEVAAMLGVSLEFLEKHKVTHYRGLLQWWGTEYRRQMFSEQYWLVRMGAFIEFISGNSKPNQVLVVTDCRFPNEATYLREHGATIIKVERPSLVSTDSHASEALVDTIVPDLTIVNDGTLEEFKEKILKTIPALLL